MEWATLVAAAYSDWSRQRAAERAQGSPALALAEQRLASTRDAGWIVATGGSTVRQTNQDVLPGVNAAPLDLGGELGTLTTAGVNNGTALLIGAVVVAYLLARKH